MIEANSLYGPLDPAPDAGWTDGQTRMGFFTDTSVCIGCKACEVACKEWNDVPASGFDLLGMSYDNTGALTANSWRHVAFIEQPLPAGHRTPPFAAEPTGETASPASAAAAADTAENTGTARACPPVSRRPPRGWPRGRNSSACPATDRRGAPAAPRGAPTSGG